jgi:hypothetical protein
MNVPSFMELLPPQRLAVHIAPATIGVASTISRSDAGEHLYPIPGIATSQRFVEVLVFRGPQDRHGEHWQRFAMKYWIFLPAPASGDGL